MTSREERIWRWTQIMDCISRHPGMTRREIADALALDMGKVARATDALYQLHYAYRTLDDGPQTRWRWWPE